MFLYSRPETVKRSTVISSLYDVEEVNTKHAIIFHLVEKSNQSDEHSAVIGKQK